MRWGGVGGGIMSGITLFMVKLLKIQLTENYLPYPLPGANLYRLSSEYSHVSGNLGSPNTDSGSPDTATYPETLPFF